MEARLKISVVVPTHRPEMLARCLASLDAQTRSPDERLVVDGYLSPALARNEGLDRAAGDVVAFIDDDAIAAPDWLEKLESCLRETGAFGAGGPALPAFEKPAPPWLTRSRKAMSSVGAFRLEGGRRPLSMPREFLIGTNCAYRRSSLRFRVFNAGVRGFGLEDVDYTTRASALGAIWYEPAATVTHAIPARKLTLTHLARFAFDNGRKKVEAGRPLMPQWRTDWRGVDAWISAFSAAGYACEKMLGART